VQSKNLGAVESTHHRPVLRMIAIKRHSVIRAPSRARTTVPC
jgi:hypothetical protein